MFYDLVGYYQLGLALGLYSFVNVSHNASPGGRLRISAPLLDDAEEQQLPGAMTDEFFMYKYKILG